jgi:hypothetical protein
LANGGIKNTTHPHPNLAKNKVGSHNPNTIQVCTAKKVNIIMPATTNEILALSDMPSKAFIFYNSDFLNPHLLKNHLEGQKPVHTPTFNINVTKITIPQDWVK